MYSIRQQQINFVIAQNQKKALWAKVHMAKEIAERANVTRKLGEIDAHEKNLTLLERFRRTLGEDVYKACVQELFSSMPSPMSFADNCAVICIDGNDDNLVICEKQDATTEKEMCDEQT